MLGKWENKYSAIWRPTVRKSLTANQEAKIKKTMFAEHFIKTNWTYGNLIFSASGWPLDTLFYFKSRANLLLCFTLSRLRKNKLREIEQAGAELCQAQY